MANRPAEETEMHKADVTSDALLDVIHELIAESSTTALSRSELKLDSRLEHDLGLDSLALSELVDRLGNTFGSVLPDDALLAETPRDLLGLIQQAAGLELRETSVTQVELPGAGGVLPSAATTLVEVLDWYRERHPQRVHILHYSQPDQADEMSYQTLWQGAARVATGLWQQGVRQGDRVALMLPTGNSYFFSFFGILMAGSIPVPIYPPTRPSQLEEHLRRHGRILQNAGVRLLITVPEASGVARLLRTQVPSLQHIVEWAELDNAKGAPPSPAGSAQDIAFLQYTSGSTGDPKGVVLTHSHLLANIRAMGEAIEVTPNDVFVSWLPLYHDMGLIGAWLGSLYFGLPLVVMSPLQFLARPSRWLWAIHRHRGTLSASPNFGYELCLNKVTEEEIEGLDLSAWRCAFNGAEPVSATTLRRFGKRFAAYGLSRQTLSPVYGLAEAAVGLAFPPPGRGPLIDRVRREHFMVSGEALAAPKDDPDPLDIVACGRALPGYRVQVVDETGSPLPERREGRLEFRGPSATSGYFNNPEASERLFRGGWLDTGDRAYIADGDIYITGRIKEMIIRGGRNIYPYEVEEAIGALPGIRKGCVAVFPCDDADTGTERLIVIAESRERDAERLQALQRTVRQQVTDLLGLPPDDVVVAPPHTVLKTSSGKLRRGTMRSLYAQGRLGRRERPLPLQVLRLLLSGLLQRLLRIHKGAGRYLFAAYAWSLFWILVPQVWLSVVLLPRRSWRWAVIRLAIRVLRRSTATPLRVEGLEKLPPLAQPCILVANHASYLDPLALIDALPREFVYVAKQELTQKFHSRVFLQRLGTLFVERFDSLRGAASASEFAAQLRAGRSLVFFPEGTFRTEPGLLPFYMGAFVAAVRSGVPIVPATIRGTREILRADSDFPHHGAVQVIIESPMEPQGEDWAEALRLRTAARAVIASQCDEQYP
jgi:1-acyl-sn-glycerol-3-phosphate acyltransferase